VHGATGKNGAALWFDNGPMLHVQKKREGGITIGHFSEEAAYHWKSWGVSRGDRAAPMEDP